MLKGKEVKVADKVFRITVTIRVTADEDVDIEKLKHDIANFIPMELFIESIEI